jgi:hypothetical protein
MNMPMAPTDKTDKTPRKEVLAVLAVGGSGIFVYGEHDFLTAYAETTTRLNAAWPDGMMIKELPNYADIKRCEAAAG